MKAKPSISVAFTATLMLDEGEARALHAMFGYGARSFLDVFYKHLGTHYLKPHEPEVFTLAESVNAQLVPALAHFDEVRRLSAGASTVHRERDALDARVKELEARIASMGTDPPPNSAGENHSEGTRENNPERDKTQNVSKTVSEAQ
jgi:hypothetical protein